MRGPSSYDPSNMLDLLGLWATFMPIILSEYCTGTAQSAQAKGLKIIHSLSLALVTSCSSQPHPCNGECQQHLECEGYRPECRHNQCNCTAKGLLVPKNTDRIQQESQPICAV